MSVVQDTLMQTPRIKEQLAEAEKLFYAVVEGRKKKDPYKLTVIPGPDNPRNFTIDPKITLERQKGAVGTNVYYLSMLESAGLVAHDDETWMSSGIREDDVFHRKFRPTRKGWALYRRSTNGQYKQ